MAAIETLEDCISRLPVAVRNQPVSNLHEIAESLSNWQTVLPYLGLKEEQEESIVDDHNRTATRRLEALRTWSRTYGGNATYEKLLTSFYRAKRMDMVERVIAVAGGTSDAQRKAPTGSTIHSSSVRNPWLIVAVTVVVAGISIGISFALLQSGEIVPGPPPAPVNSVPLTMPKAVPKKNTAERESRESSYLLTPPAAETGTERESNGPLCAKVKDARVVISKLRDITDWRVLGFELGVKEARLEAIDGDENKVEHKRMATIRAWYDATVDAHWDPVVRALINMNKNKIASSIAEEFCGNHDLSSFEK